MVDCPICSKPVKAANINRHIDSNCESFVEATVSTTSQNESDPKVLPTSSFFRTPSSQKTLAANLSAERPSKTRPLVVEGKVTNSDTPSQRSQDENQKSFNDDLPTSPNDDEPPAKRHKPSTALSRAAPLADRMRPSNLDDIYGQPLVSPTGILRSLIDTSRVPSMILWGGPGTGKTTIARLIANRLNSRFVEINSTSTGVADVKKIFTDARGELSLTGRKTIFFCDEIHRFSRSQQDVFLGPVERGEVVLVGATTENPSFKVTSALLSRCRVFTLRKLSTEDIVAILSHALTLECPTLSPPLLTPSLLSYLASFADGDARTALNLLELALATLAVNPSTTVPALKAALTQSLVYDRAGDQHYDTISAFHKSLRGSDPDAALYYLARMLQSGEDPLYIARRMVVVASEDVGLADNSLLPLATAAHAAAEKIGMPECRINLAHCAVALALAGKSTRAYRGLGAATKALEEPGVAGLPVPVHLRNAPTRLMKEMGYGREYKYNPDYKMGKCKQEYLPEELRGRRFLEGEDLGQMDDPDLVDGEW